MIECVCGGGINFKNLIPPTFKTMRSRKEKKKCMVSYTKVRIMWTNHWCELHGLVELTWNKPSSFSNFSHVQYAKLDKNTDVYRK